MSGIGDAYGLLRRFFRRGYSSSLLVMSAGVELILFALGIGSILLIYGVLIAWTTDGLGAVIGAIPLSWFEIIVLIATAIVYKLTEYVQNLSKYDPYGNIHSVDIILGILFVSLGTYLFTIISPGAIFDEGIELRAEFGTILGLVFSIFLIGVFRTKRRIHD